MPLDDDEWTRGKCSFKMLQYMAVAIPVIVSPVGMNNQVLMKGNCGIGAKSNEEWYSAFEALYNDNSLKDKMGLVGRNIVEENFSVVVVNQKLAEIFNNFNA